jgi:DNA polymerase-3 subunit delta
MRSLDYDTLWKALRKGVVRPVYYLHGDEELLKDESVQGLIDAGVDASTRDFNLDRRRAAELTAEDFHSLVQTPPMMAARRGVVVSEVEWLQQKKPKAQALRTAVLAYAAQPSPETMLVLVQSASREKGDRREKILSPDPVLARVAETVAFDPLSPHRLEGWIRHEAGRLSLALDDAAITHLMAAVGGDLPALAAELAKLGTAVGERTATADDVADLVGVRHGETVPDFVDAVTGRRAVEAAAMLPRLLDAPGSSAVRLVMSLGAALVGVGLARALLDEGMNPNAVEGQLPQAIRDAGVWLQRDWRQEARAWTRYASRWTLPEVDAALEELLRADRRIKNTKVAGGAEILQEALLAMAGQAAGIA